MNAYDGVYNRRVKRVLGFVVALPFLAVALPLYLAIAFAIVIDDGFPVFYRPYRGGYRGKKFRIVKFRTMVRNADQIGGGTTGYRDPRITRVGAFLRKTKLDETANLVNILLGTMSFVGPRPELLQYTEKYEDEEKVILEVRPGVTDFSSLEFINLDERVGDDDPDEVYETQILGEKNRLRIKYARSVSFKTDFLIFCKTVLTVVQKALCVVFRLPLSGRRLRKSTQTTIEPQKPSVK